MIQDIQSSDNLRCNNCGNSNSQYFDDITGPDDVYRHLFCCICHNELIAWKTKASAR
jgi:hypothetical protein